MKNFSSFFLESLKPTKQVLIWLAKPSSYVSLCNLYPYFADFNRIRKIECHESYILYQFCRIDLIEVFVNAMHSGRSSSLRNLDLLLL